MADGHRELGLEDEALLELRVALLHLGVEDLHGELVAARIAPDEVDGAHAARAQQPHDRVVAELTAGLQEIGIRPGAHFAASSVSCTRFSAIWRFTPRSTPFVTARRYHFAARRRKAAASGAGSPAVSG